MRSLFKALRSLRLAIILIGYMVVSSALASLVPQGREASYYYSTLSAFTAALVVKSGFSHFFGSALFLLPALLFFVNLSACSAWRLAREFGKERKARRHGPDLLHLGLVLLLLSVAGGRLATMSEARDEGFVRLRVGDSVQLSGGRILRLSAFEMERYPDGRPKEWISTAEISVDGSPIRKPFRIRVNHPLRLGALSIYQASYGTERVLELETAEGEKRSLAAGESLDMDAGRIMLMSVDLDTGESLAREENPAGERIVRLARGSKLGPYTVAGAKEVGLSGLKASYDPAYPAVVASLAIVLTGICMTLARKLGDLKA